MHVNDSSFLRGIYLTKDIGLCFHLKKNNWYVFRHRKSQGKKWRFLLQENITLARQENKLILRS